MISLYMNDPKISKAFQVILSDFTGGAGAGAGGFGGAPGAGGAGFGGFEKPAEEAKTETTFKEEQPEPKKPEPKQEVPKPKGQVTPADEEKNKGNEEYKKKNFDQAIVHYEKAIELDPNEPIYYNNLAAVYVEKKQYDKAIEACDKAEEVCKTAGQYDYVKLAKILARKAAAYSHKGDYQTSLEYYQRSLLENNDYKVKEEMKKIEKTKKEAEIKAYINPEIAEQHRLKGNELYGEGKFPDAIKEYDEAIKRNPTEAKLYANRGTALMKLMEYPTALRDIDKCLELDPNYVKAYAKKGVIHHFLKEFHKALEAYEKGLKIEPGNEECKSGLEKTRFAIMGGHQGESKEEQDSRLRRAMEDPEVRAIMQDPQIMQLLRDLQERPSDPNNVAALRDPEVAKKIDKLIAAGILRMG